MPSTALGERLEAGVRLRAGKAAQVAAVRMEVALKAAWQPHRKTGATQAATSVKLESVDRTTITYVARAATPQAKFVNDGTPAHIITPRANPGAPSGPKMPVRAGERALVFFWARAGRRVAMRWVEHPGYAGDGWWDRTIDRWSEFLSSAFGD